MNKDLWPMSTMPTTGFDGPLVGVSSDDPDPHAVRTKRTAAAKTVAALSLRTAPLTHPNDKASIHCVGIPTGQALGTSSDTLN